MTNAFAAEEKAEQGASVQSSNSPASSNQTSTQVPADQVPPELSAESMMKDNLFILAMLFFIFYFILIRPQQKRLKVQTAMMKGLQKGNKIMTTGGILGTIAKFEGDDIVVVEIAQGVKIRMSRNAVSEVVSDKSSGESANDN